MGGTRVVKWEAGWKEGDFIGAIIKAGGLVPGSVVVLEYRHDEWCPRTASGRGCKCDPDVCATVRPAGPHDPPRVGRSPL